jgi:hypothetical protein
MIHELKGSDKQIAWAKTIRDKWISALSRYKNEQNDDFPASEKVVQNLEFVLEKIGSSSFWIQNRNLIESLLDPNYQDRFGDYEVFSGYLEQDIKSLHFKSKLFLKSFPDDNH